MTWSGKGKVAIAGIGFSELSRRSDETLGKLAFDAAGLNWKDHVTLDERFLRPAEVDLLVGDASTARGQLCWEPSVSFEQMVEIMVNADVRLLKGEDPPAGMPANIA